MDTLCSHNLRLRCLEPTDIDFFYQWENETGIWQHADTLAPYSRHLLQNYIDNYDPDIFAAKQLRLVVTLKEREEVIGSVDLYELDMRNNHVALGILMSDKHRGKGFAYEALKIAERYCTEILGLTQIIAYIDTTNEISVRLFEKAGYEKCGTIKKWHRFGNRYHDVHLYQLILQ